MSEPDAAASDARAEYTLPLDAYEAANLLAALTTHACLDSGDWYVQVRDRLRALTRDNVTAPNPFYCQNYGHAKWRTPLQAERSTVESELQIKDK
jgi:hypothetical protein